MERSGGKRCISNVLFPLLPLFLLRMCWFHSTGRAPFKADDTATLSVSPIPFPFCPCWRFGSFSSDFHPKYALVHLVSLIVVVVKSMRAGVTISDANLATKYVFFRVFPTIASIFMQTTKVVAWDERGNISSQCKKTKGGGGGGEGGRSQIEGEGGEYFLQPLIFPDALFEFDTLEISASGRRKRIAGEVLSV